MIVLFSPKEITNLFACPLVAALELHLVDVGAKSLVDVCTHLLPQLSPQGVVGWGVVVQHPLVRWGPYRLEDGHLQGRGDFATPAQKKVKKL